MLGKNVSLRDNIWHLECVAIPLFGSKDNCPNLRLGEKKKRKKYRNWWFSYLEWRHPRTNFGKGYGLRNSSPFQLLFRTWGEFKGGFVCLFIVFGWLVCFVLFSALSSTQYYCSGWEQSLPVNSHRHMLEEEIKNKMREVTVLLNVFINCQGFLKADYHFFFPCILFQWEQKLFHSK